MMKMKISEWGNSHGIRITSPILEHLNVVSGDQINYKLTDNGIEIIKNTQSEE